MEAGGIGAHNGRGNRHYKGHYLNLSILPRRNYCIRDLSVWSVDQEKPLEVVVLVW